MMGWYNLINQFQISGGKRPCWNLAIDDPAMQNWRKTGILPGKIWHSPDGWPPDGDVPFALNFCTNSPHSGYWQHLCHTREPFKNDYGRAGGIFSPDYFKRRPQFFERPLRNLIMNSWISPSEYNLRNWVRGIPVPWLFQLVNISAEFGFGWYIQMLRFKYWDTSPTRNFRRLVLRIKWLKTWNWGIYWFAFRISVWKWQLATRINPESPSRSRIQRKTMT